MRKNSSPQSVSTCWGAEEIQQNNVLLLNAVLLQNFDRLHDRVASGQDRIQQQHSSLLDVNRELGVQHSRFVRDLIALYQNLSDAYRPTAVPQAFLHRFAGPDHRY